MNAIMTNFDIESREARQTRNWEGLSEIDQAIRDNRVDGVSDQEVLGGSLGPEADDRGDPSPCDLRRFRPLLGCLVRADLLPFLYVICRLGTCTLCTLGNGI